MPPHDINAAVSFLLRDLAAVQTSPQKAFGYKRAAAAVFSLEAPLTFRWTEDGLDPPVPGVGPASTRIIREVLHSGTSPTVEGAVEGSGRRADVARRRTLRANFLSRAAVIAVLDTPGPGPTRGEYRGDFQMHSEWSDGSPTLREIVDGCLARGYIYAAVTDHSYGLRIAGGISMDEARQQHQEIDQLNRRISAFHLFKGIEANIAADGSLDLAAEEAEQFDVVLSAPHSKLRTTDDQTARLIRAIRFPATRILAHPRGRIVGSRAGLVADWDAVFAAAAAAGVAIELDGDPARQDLDYVLATAAVKAGCVFALDSDAHTVGQLQYSETAMAHARLAQIPADRIVNCWPIDRLRAWLDDRETARANRADSCGAASRQ
jgi:putative hydrolase